MKKSLTTICILLGLCSVAAIVVAIMGYVYDLLTLGIIFTIVAAAILWFFAGNIYRESIFTHVEAAFSEKNFAKARDVIDRAERNMFFYPIVRVLVFQLGLRTAIGLDDIPEAARYIESIRHLGGSEWRFKTAYFVIMINLDWEDITAARGEYEDFRDACGATVAYAEQLEILDAVFAHIDGSHDELPGSAKESEYPVVHRVLRKYC